MHQKMTHTFEGEVSKACRRMLFVEPPFHRVLPLPGQLPILICASSWSEPAQLIVKLVPCKVSVGVYSNAL